MKQGEGETSGQEGQEEGMEKQEKIEYNWSATKPSVAIVEAISVITNQKPEDIEPLYNRMDAEAMDDLILSARENSTDLQVSFKHDGVDILVNSDGEIHIRP
ncbi:MAG: HalOD1 output domain-containing protein [Halobacteria archaeon]|nr:HalOD1 output domain-containing protein [Halobacteria archaeon]